MIKRTMSCQYEYKVIPAPSKGQKAPGVKTSPARFAYAVESSLNALASEGWQYVRADTLPHEERQGLTGTTTSFRSLLVFRRPVDASVHLTEHPSPQDNETRGGVSGSDSETHDDGRDLTRDDQPSEQGPAQQDDIAQSNGFDPADPKVAAQTLRQS